MKINQQELIQKLKSLDIIYRDKVALRGGEISEYYIDIKKAYGDPVAFSLLCEAMSGLMDKEATCVAAAGYGGLPLATALSLKNNLKLILVRDAEKKHGKRGMIDGFIPSPQDKIIIVDDVITTGGSVSETLGALKKTGAEVMGVCVVFERRPTQLEIPIKHLLNVEELL